MKHLSTTSLLALSALPFIPTQAEAQQKSRPNVIIVITDDQGKGDLGCLGNDIIKTPNIDAFYSDAVRLNNFHVSPTSAPTRSALMTGRFTNRLNCFHTIAGRDRVYEDEVLMSQVFAQNGYATAMYGKWHLGDNYPYRPEDKGFHEVVRHGGGGIGQAPDYWGNDYFDDTYLHNGEYQKYEGYCTDVFFDEAMDFIEKNHERPFFCYIATNAPHSPLNVPQEYYDLYEDTELGSGTKRFYGMITNIDDNFKRLEDKLKKLKIADNTILIFMTDNGTGGGYATNNGGMRGKKGSNYEGGHCVPFFIKWKDGNLTGGRDVDNLTAHIDVFPTFVELCDLNFVPVKPIDGVDITPLLRGTSTSWADRCLVTDSQRVQSLVKWKSSAVMTERWRLIDGKELYEIKKDKMQKTDIAAENPELVTMLRWQYESWWESLRAEEADTRYSYIWVGSRYENPVRFSSHELHSESVAPWNQGNILKATPGKGIYKLNFVTEGKYKITLCRYPTESGYRINEDVAAAPKISPLVGSLPASNDVKMASASLYVGSTKKTIKVKDSDYGVTFDVDMPEGKFDMEATFTDTKGYFYPAYYVYVEKL